MICSSPFVGGSSGGAIKMFGSANGTCRCYRATKWLQCSTRWHLTLDTFQTQACLSCSKLSILNRRYMQSHSLAYIVEQAATPASAAAPYVPGKQLYPLELRCIVLKLTLPTSTDALRGPWGTPQLQIGSTESPRMIRPPSFSATAQNAF